MTRNEPSAAEIIRAAAEGLRREGRSAADEIRVELGAARRETRSALREAMAEMQAALREAWPPPGDTAEGGAAARLSRAERKELTRELLLDAAIEVFARKGYHGATLDDVAEAAGFTKGAVYSNFSRKADLFLALLERESRRRNEALGEGIEAAPFEALPDMAAAWLQRQSDDDRDWDLLTVEFWLAAVRDETIRETLCSGRDAAMEGFGELIDRKLDEAGVRPGLSGRDIAVLVDALGTGLLMDRYLDAESDTRRLFATALRKLLADTADPPSDPGDHAPGGQADR